MDDNFKNNLFKQRLLHITYTLSLAGNIVTFFVYWLFVHSSQVKLLNTLLSMFETVLIHSLPLVASLTNSAVTSVCLSRRMAPAILFFNIVVIGLNFVTVKFVNNGKPTFELMHWNSVETPVFGIFLAVFLAFGYLMLCKMNEFFKKDMFKRKTYKFVKKKKKA